jgi:hypothetical protein
VAGAVKGKLTFEKQVLSGQMLPVPTVSPHKYTAWILYIRCYEEIRQSLLGEVANQLTLCELLTVWAVSDKYSSFI